MWNLQKAHDDLLCRSDADSQTVKNLWFPKWTGRGWGDALRLWDGNAVKFGCDDCCTHINVIKLILKKEKKSTIQYVARYLMNLT